MLVVRRAVSSLLSVSGGCVLRGGYPALSQRAGSGRAGKPVPRCKALLLCERALRDAGTGQFSLIGIVRQFVVPRLPAQSPPVTAYLQLAEGIGSYAISAAVGDLSTGQALAEGQGASFSFPDRLTVLEILLPLPPLPLRHEGSFDLVVSADGQEVERQKFAVVLSPAGGP